MKITPEYARQIAHKKLDTLGWQYTGTGLFHDLLLNMKDTYFLPVENYAAINQTLEPASCVGRAALCAAFVEKHYNKTVLGCDVIEDWFRSMIHPYIQQTSGHPDILAEVLVYEDPHAIIMVDNQQFEPLSKVTGRMITHPQVDTYPVWNMIASGLLCAEAKLAQDFAQKQQLIEQASEYAETMEVLDHKIFIYGLTDKFNLAMVYCKKILERKKSARILYVLSKYDSAYANRLVIEYSPNIFKFFQ